MNKFVNLFVNLYTPEQRYAFKQAIHKIKGKDTITDSLAIRYLRFCCYKLGIDWKDVDVRYYLPFRFQLYKHRAQVILYCKQEMVVDWIDFQY